MTHQRNNPLLLLTLSRFREFVREPAAIFWVYGFPLIMAVALGVAFRERPVEKIKVTVREDVGSPEAIAAPQDPPGRGPRVEGARGTRGGGEGRLRAGGS